MPKSMSEDYVWLLKGVVFSLAQSKYGTNVAKLHDAFKGAYKWLAEKFNE